MQWNNERNYQNQVQTDVYQDVKTPYSASFFESSQTIEDTQEEFSLEDIQRKLGIYDPDEKKDVVVDKGDAKPSNQTWNMTYARDYIADETASKSRVSTKQKVAIASYAVLILALVIAVTLCGVSVSGSFGAATALYTEYTETTSVVADLSAQVATEDYAALAERAAELGYIDASRSNTQTYTEIETRPAQNFNVESNWFDALCDWLSGAFGG